MKPNGHEVRKRTKVAKAEEKFSYHYMLRVSSKGVWGDGFSLKYFEGYLKCLLKKCSSFTS